MLTFPCFFYTQYNTQHLNKSSLSGVCVCACIRGCVCQCPDGDVSGGGFPALTVVWGLCVQLSALGSENQVPDGGTGRDPADIQRSPGESQSNPGQLQQTGKLSVLPVSKQLRIICSHVNYCFVLGFFFLLRAMRLNP